MKTLFTLALIALAFVAQADTPTAAKVKLRELAKMPSISLTFAFRYDRKGVTMDGENRDLKAEMAELRAAMKGAPSDAELYVKLSELQELDGADDKVVEATKDTAISLYRRRLAAQPDNGRIMAELAELLSENDEERKTLLHRAVQASPNEWRCWTALGNDYFLDSMKVLFGLQARDVDSPLALLARLPTMQKPSPEQIKQSNDLMQQAQTHLDKAVALAPGEPEVYRARIISRQLKNVFDLIPKASAGGLAGINGQQVIFTPQVLDDLKQLAKTDRKNYRVAGAIIIFETGANLDEKADIGPTGAMIDAVPEKVRSSIRQQIDHLEQLADDPDKKAAFGALVVLGGTKMTVTGNFAGAAKDMRRALALQPLSDLAIKFLVSALMFEKSYDEALTACKAWVERTPTLDGYLYLARIYETLKQYDKAEEQVEAALKTAPGDYACLLAMASLLLQKPDEQSSLKAYEYLQKAREAFDKLPDKEQTDERKVDLLLRLSICFALNDQVSFARKGLNQIAEHDKKNQDAKDALAALDALQK